MLSRASIIVIGIMLMITGTAMHCYSEDSSEANRTKTAQGDVTDIDWVGSILTVDDTAFSVASDAKVIKGSDEISFSEINVGDRVKVAYIREKDGSLKAVRIVVVYSGDFPI